MSTFLCFPLSAKKKEMWKQDSLFLSAQQQSLSDYLSGRAAHLLEEKSLLQYCSNSFLLQVKFGQNFEWSFPTFIFSSIDFRFVLEHAEVNAQLYTQYVHACGLKFSVTGKE